MAVELAGIPLDKLTHVEVCEQARFARLRVPGSEGDRFQDLGRHGARVVLRGLFYGPGSEERLKELRARHLDRRPVDFLCEAAGGGYFSQVVVESLHVTQHAGYPGQFEYVCRVAECAPRPETPAASPLAKVESGIRAEAVASLDAIQESVQESFVLAKEVERTLALTLGFHSPKERLAELVNVIPDSNNLPKAEDLEKLLSDLSSGPGNG
jgi:hypothetical protein